MFCLRNLKVTSACFNCSFVHLSSVSLWIRHSKRIFPKLKAMLFLRSVSATKRLYHSFLLRSDEMAWKQNKKYTHLGSIEFKPFFGIYLWICSVSELIYNIFGIVDRANVSQLTTNGWYAVCHLCILCGDTTYAKRVCVFFFSIDFVNKMILNVPDIAASIYLYMYFIHICRHYMLNCSNHLKNMRGVFVL